MICVKNRNKWGTFYSLTIGKSYNVIDKTKIDDNILIRIIDDEGREWRYYDTYFINLKKLRKQKIEKLNII